ncbi:MAG: NmrA family NAD(P)-binding protein [Steroidobacteraceae bacterium]
MKSQQAPVLIIGANGKTGRRVNALLERRGVATRGASRSTTPSFDWTRPEGWAAALEGVSKAYVTCQPDLAVTGADAAIAELSDIARRKGLERVVLLSGRGEPGAQRAEKALQTSGVPWTIVRASWFNQNFSEGYMLDGVLAGEVALPAGAIPEPFVDADDIAEVAAAAVVDARHVDRIYEVTGPRALTFTQAVDEIAAGLGRPVRYTQITPEDFVISLRAYVPEDIVQLMNELFTVVLDGRNTQVKQGVAEALGRPARDFSVYVRETVRSGAWS